MDRNDESPFEERLSRRDLLRRGAIGGAMLGAAPMIGAGVASAMPARAAKAGQLTPPELAALKAALGPVNPKYSGKGETWNIGALLPLSGPGLPQGVSMSRGIALAAKHIKAIGGPTIKADIQDVGTLDVTKGKDAILQMAGKKIPAVVSSYGGVGGVVLPTLASDHILAIDSAGGNGTEQSKPYFWGMRPTVGVSEMPLVCNFLRQKMPSVKNLGMTIFNVASFTAATTAELQAIVAKYPPLKITTIVNPAYGATDFSAEIAALRAGNPDAVISFEFENDAGYFLKQYATSGINKPVFNFESYIASIVQIANGGYERQYLAVDDFFVGSQNPFAYVLIKDFQATYGKLGVPGAAPDYYTAGAYNNTTLFWQLYMAVKQGGGSVNSGADLQAALKHRLTFPSVFGGGPGAIGHFSFDPVTQGLKHWPVALYQVRKGVPVRIETGDMTGSNLRFVKG